jgi:hypothetical protein
VHPFDDPNVIAGQGTVGLEILDDVPDAALVVVVHPGLIAYGLKYHPRVLDSLLSALVALTTTTLVMEMRWAPALRWGLTLGVCLLTRPTILVIVPFAVAWVLAGGGLRRGGRVVAIGLVVAVLVVTPWLVRNYRTHHVLVLGRSNMGYMLWLGNNPLATGSLWIDRDTPIASRMPGELRRAVEAEKNELAQDRLFRREALHYIAAHPGEAARLALRKFVYFWWFAPEAGHGIDGRLFAAYKAAHLTVLVLAAVGVLTLPNGLGSIGAQVAVFVAAFPLAVSIVQTPFFVEVRHRLALEWALAVLAGHGLTRLLSRTRESRAP